MDIENLFNRLLLEKRRTLLLSARGRAFKGYLVGFKPLEYLIIEVPRSAEIAAVLREGHLITGLFNASGTEVRFESSITAYLKKPAWLLFVKYPSSLERIHDLRNSKTVECSIPCILTTLFNLIKFPGLIADINVDGCKCLLSSLAPIQAEMFTSGKKVLLDFDLPGRQGRKMLFGEVSNLKRDSAKVSLSIKFCDNDDETALKELKEYVLNLLKLAPG